MSDQSPTTELTRAEQAVIAAVAWMSVYGWPWLWPFATVLAVAALLWLGIGYLVWSAHCHLMAGVGIGCPSFKQFILWQF